MEWRNDRKIVEGAVFEVQHPFKIGSFTELDAEGSFEIPCWEVGINRGMRPPEGREYGYADGIGQQILTVVAVFKPGKYPARVFYTRKWRDPSGKEFGKGALRITSLTAFRQLIRGYRYAFELDPPHTFPKGLEPLPDPPVDGGTGKEGR